MIAFLSHEASRTGAPIMFLHFLKWFKANHKESFLIVIKNDGEISNEFKKLGKTFIIYPKRNNPWINRLTRILGSGILYIKLRILLLVFKINKVKLIYSNSITNGNINLFFSSHGISIITHVHELEHIISRYGKSNIQAVLKSTDYFIAASEAVKNNLTSRYNINPGLIDIIYECIDFKGETKFSEKDRINSLREMGIDNPNAFIVGGSGILDFRKATEIFVLVANQTIATNPELPFYFIWVGADANDNLYSWFLSDIEKMELNGRIMILPATTNPFKYYKLFNLFLLTSREDPFPLVCLENAALATPVLCFEKAGGMTEFVKDDAGVIIKYLDIVEMAETIENLYHDEKLCRTLGENARKRAINNHNVNFIAPQIEKVINKARGN